MRHINRILTVNKLGYQVNHWKTLIIADAVGLSPLIYLVETKDRRTTLNVSVPALLRNNCFNRSTNTHICWSPTLHRSSLYRYSTSKGTDRGPKIPQHRSTLLPHKFPNKAVKDCRLHPSVATWIYFKHTSFSCRYTQRHYVQTWCYRYSTCPLQPSRPWLQEVVPSIPGLQRVFLRTKPKPACEPHCLSLAVTSSSLSLLQKWRHL